MAFVAPIPQDPLFHHFADQRNCWNIPNCWNVLSNIGFLLVGFIGLYQLFIIKKLHIVPEMKMAYAIFFMGIVLVAFGSGYYHWKPNNQTLVWDRLPMTIAFMALLAIALAEYLSVAWGRFSLWPLLFIGTGSVYYWHWGEQHGMGDLRPYALVQFLPMVLLPILLVFGQPRFKGNGGYWLLFCAYALAKAAEHFDFSIFGFTLGSVAGHAIKHVVTEVGLYVLLLFYKQRAFLVILHKR